MKKFFIVMLLVLFTSSVFAQSVLDNDGYVWVSWTSMEKTKYVLGWMSSLDSLRQFLSEIKGSSKLTGNSEELRSLLFDWATYSGTVQDMIILLDRIYSNPDARKYKIWDVILTSYNKEWW